MTCNNNIINNMLKSNAKNLSSLLKNIKFYFSKIPLNFIYTFKINISGTVKYESNQPL